MPNCKTCKHWKKDHSRGVCERLDSMDNDLFDLTVADVEIYTSPEFGCILHEGEPC